jgi:hypothetical protein
MSEITEIIEETANQIEIIETGVGQIEVIAEEKTQIEIIESSFLDSQIRGSVTSSQNSISITGSNTFFTTDLSIGDTVKIRSASFDLNFTIASIESDTLLTLGGLWTGNTYTGSLIFKQLLGGSINTGDLDIELETNIITIESPTQENNIINISEDSITNIDVIETITRVDIMEKSFVSGAFDFSFFNILSNPFNTVENLDRIGTKGVINPNFNLHVSGTSFADNISSSKVIVQGDGNEDLLLIKIGNNDPSVKVNPIGVVELDEYTFTPTPTRGGLLFSGSSFYLGLD